MFVELGSVLRRRRRRAELDDRKAGNAISFPPRQKVRQSARCQNAWFIRVSTSRPLTNKRHGQPALRLTDPCKYIGETAGRTTVIRRNVARYALLFGRLVKSVVGSGNSGFSSQSKIADAVDRARHARIWGERWAGCLVWMGLHEPTPPRLCLIIGFHARQLTKPGRNTSEIKCDIPW